MKRPQHADSARKYPVVIIEEPKEVTPGNGRSGVPGKPPLAPVCIQHGHERICVPGLQREWPAGVVDHDKLEVGSAGLLFEHAADRSIQ